MRDLLLQILDILEEWVGGDDTDTGDETNNDNDNDNEGGN